MTAYNGVSIQLIAPASGANPTIKTIYGFGENVSIQLIAPASGAILCECYDLILIKFPFN